MAKSAVLAGATGLVGSQVLNALLGDSRYERVVAVGRRPLAQTHPKLQAVVADFDNLADSAADIAGDDAFCCLGTTMKTAGSKEAFRKVDYDYVVRFSVLARRKGARRLALVSAIGASLKSPAFYPRVKAEAERDVSNLGYEAVHIFRPSLLLGDRQEHRPGEKYGTFLFKAVEPLLFGPLRRYHTVDSADVAQAMVAAMNTPETGVVVHEYDAIHELAKR